MNKYDYITATTLEEKVRLEKLIKYMEDNNIEDNLLEYKERYNNICKYLVAKDKYLNIEKDIDDIKIKLDELYKKKDEYEVDNLLLEENGINLSGGQRQRIILARALLKTSSIVLIDEGLNEIDIKLERQILNNIFNYYKDRTFIIISHRLNNSDLFNNIIKLESRNTNEF